MPCPYRLRSLRMLKIRLRRDSKWSFLEVLSSDSNVKQFRLN